MFIRVRVRLCFAVQYTQGGVIEFRLRRNICSLTAVFSIQSVSSHRPLTLSLYTEISYSSITPVRRCQGYYEARVCDPLVPQTDRQTWYLHSAWLFFHSCSSESGQLISLRDLVVTQPNGVTVYANRVHLYIYAHYILATPNISMCLSSLNCQCVVSNYNKSILIFQNATTFYCFCNK